LISKILALAHTNLKKKAVQNIVIEREEEINVSLAVGSSYCICRTTDQQRGNGSHENIRADFYARKQLCFQRVLAIAILSVRPSVCLSVTRVDKAKAVQARISKSSPSAARKTLVSGTVKIIHKFEGGHPERGF